ncbi:hypothetical protein AB0F17_59840 [Nonomuraea sp. NPDC026600]|uniref:hypothetical protein n=1 Tax=Nonomuraea sp. NPDC026600 TaxID=3155363 RepID=UPI0033E14F6C
MLNTRRRWVIVWGVGLALAGFTTIVAYWARFPALAGRYGLVFALALDLAGPSLMVAAAILRTRGSERRMRRIVTAVGLFWTALAAFDNVAVAWQAFELERFFTYNQDSAIVIGPMFTYMAGYMIVLGIVGAWPA